MKILLKPGGFEPATAKRILADAVAARAPIAVFEFVGRNVPMLFGIGFAWLAVLLVMPSVRPLDLRFLVLTYLVPVLPLVVTWDGEADAKEFAKAIWYWWSRCRCLKSRTAISSSCVAQSAAWCAARCVAARK